MNTVMDLDPAMPRPGVRAALIVAAAASAMAALVHVVAAAGHEGDRILVWMFAASAAAQLCWAVAISVRPSRRMLVLGLVVNGGALLVWVASRTTGVPFIDSLAEADAVGRQDLSAALFAAASVLGSGWILLRPAARVTVTPAWTGALAAFALLAAMPALTADHVHGDDGVHLETAAGHGHDGEQAAAGSHDDAANGDDHAAAAGDDHGVHDGQSADSAGADGAGHDASASGGLVDHGAHDSTVTTDGHGGHTTSTTAGHGGHTTSTTGGHSGHTTTTTRGTNPPTGPIISLTDPRVTTAQRLIAEGLISDAGVALSAYPNVAAVEAAGYISIGDGGTDGFEHYVKWSYLTDGIELDPTRIESIVVKKDGTAPKQIVSAMYILNFGKTMANAPALAGELTSWHLHDNLCFSGTTLTAIATGGVCPLPSVLVVTPPMLHVWLIPRPCGPFSGLEEAGEICAPHGH